MGRFIRAVYMRDPKSNRQLGYWETGFLSRISHEEIDFNVLANSCRTINAKSSGIAKRFYKRNGNEMMIAHHDPKDDWAKIIFLPILLIEAFVEGMSDILTTKTAEAVFEQKIRMKPYQFEMSLLPVEWGCAIKGDFQVMDSQLHFKID